MTKPTSINVAVDEHIDAVLTAIADDLVVSKGWILRRATIHLLSTIHANGDLAEALSLGTMAAIDNLFET